MVVMGVGSGAEELELVGELVLTQSASQLADPFGVYESAQRVESAPYEPPEVVAGEDLVEGGLVLDDEQDEVVVSDMSRGKVGHPFTPSCVGLNRVRFPRWQGSARQS
jgi:hypothetical protein